MNSTKKRCWKFSRIINCTEGRFPLKFPKTAAEKAGEAEKILVADAILEEEVAAAGTVAKEGENAATVQTVVATGKNGEANEALAAGATKGAAAKEARKEAAANGAAWTGEAANETAAPKGAVSKNAVAILLATNRVLKAVADGQANAPIQKARAANAASGCKQKYYFLHKTLAGN